VITACGQFLIFNSKRDPVSIKRYFQVKQPIKMKLSLILWSSLLYLISCSTPINRTIKTDEYAVVEDSLNLFDEVRNRNIPLQLYFPKMANATKLKVIILSHGYNENQPNSNKGYTALAHFLAEKGYFIASIQHELPTDDLLPKTGIPQEVRRPNWERGVQNILFVINELKRLKTELDNKNITLMGHSNGGDMSMLFGHKYPELVTKIISFDNRRMALPRVNRPKIYSLRSSDQTADAGVLPTEAEQLKWGIKIIKLKNTKHNDMSDNANDAQRQEINGCVLQFLTD
jgi:dienelactone hydrolase